MGKQKKWNIMKRMWVSIAQQCILWMKAKFYQANWMRCEQKNESRRHWCKHTQTTQPKMPNKRKLKLSFLVCFYIHFRHFRIKFAIDAKCGRRTQSWCVCVCFFLLYSFYMSIFCFVRILSFNFHVIFFPFHLPLCFSFGVFVPFSCDVIVWCV